MRILVALTVAQLAILAVVMLRLTGLERSIAFVAVPQPISANVSVATESPARTDPRTAPTRTALDVDQLRAIVREELATALSSFAVSEDVGSPPIVAGSPDQSSEEDVADMYQWELVNSELDYYINQGAISESEMSDLQMKIAGLDTDGRKQALSKLVRALNSGDLKGRL